ncbi:hypothetical protein MRX96_008874 [Rhipicephalus microplus]
MSSDASRGLRVASAHRQSSSQPPTASEARARTHSSAQRFDGSRDEPRQAVFRACIVDGFKCGQEGHMSRDYPNSDSLSGGGGRGCFKFGFELSRDCPTASSDDRPKNGYFNCGEYNHMSRDCPNPPA